MADNPTAPLLPDLSELVDWLRAERDTMDMALAANVSFALLPLERQAALVLLCIYLGAPRLRRADDLWAALAAEQWGQAAQEVRALGSTPALVELAEALIQGGGQ